MQEIMIQEDSSFLKKKKRKKDIGISLGKGSMVQNQR